MAFKYGLIALAFSFLAVSVLAYYPYGPEYRIYGTETYIPTATYPVAYTNYSPQSYTVYSGDYASYTGYYYSPSYVGYSGYSYPLTATYWRPYYLRDYPFATSYATYNTVPTTYVTGYDYYSGYNYSPDYSVYSGYNSYNNPSVSVSYSSSTGSSYLSDNVCTQSWCVHLN